MLDSTNHTDIESLIPSLEKNTSAFHVWEDEPYGRKMTKIHRLFLRENHVTQMSSLFLSRKSKQLAHFSAGSKDEPSKVFRKWGLRFNGRTKLVFHMSACVLTLFQHPLNQPAAAETQYIFHFCIMFVNHILCAYADRLGEFITSVNDCTLKKSHCSVYLKVPFFMLISFSWYQMEADLFHILQFHTQARTHLCLKSRDRGSSPKELIQLCGHKAYRKSFLLFTITP